MQSGMTQTNESPEFPGRFSLPDWKAALNQFILLFEDWI